MKRQPRPVIWSLMIGSFSMSFLNFLTSLILSHWKMPVEYKLITCLFKAFSVFSPLSFSSRCLYSAYFLLIVSSLACFVHLYYVHLCPNLPLSMRLFNSSRFLGCSVPSFGVSTMFPRKSLSNISPTSAIALVKCRNRHQMKNYIRYKGNTNNTSAIIFLMEP